MRIHLLIAVTSAAFVLASCSSVVGDDSQTDDGSYAYTAYDSTGTVIVQGTMSIDFREVEDDECERFCNQFLLEGTWNLEQIGEEDRIGKQVGEGRLRGNVLEDGSVYINLNPRWEDNNVTLRGEFENSSFKDLQGEWAYRSWGLINGGQFEASR